MTTSSRPDGQRIAALDGLRGLAILLVLGYHAYSRHPELLPFPPAIVSFPLFEHGNLGVQLFFLISGFVILLTLQSCQGPVSFMLRRWRRLFPAMLIASLAVYATAWLIPERPQGMPRPIDLLPGLTFIDAEVWAHLLRQPVGELEGAFWSLYVEWLFYIVFGALFFSIGRRAAVLSLFAIFLAAATTSLLVLPKVGHVPVLATLLEISGFRFYGWFVCGAVFYIYICEGRRPEHLAAALGVGLCAVLATQGARTAAACVLAVFVLTLLSPQVSRLVANRLLLFFGFVSYPLYLVHENMMQGLSIRWLPVVPEPFRILVPLLPAAMAVAVAWAIASHGEPAVRRLLDGAGARARDAWRRVAPPSRQDASRPA